jgi:hypothetical protein
MVNISDKVDVDQVILPRGTER